MPRFWASLVRFSIGFSAVCDPRISLRYIETVS